MALDLVLALVSEPAWMLVLVLADVSASGLLLGVAKLSMLVAARSSQ